MGWRKAPINAIISCVEAGEWRTRSDNAPGEFGRDRNSQMKSMCGLGWPFESLNEVAAPGSIRVLSSRFERPLPVAMPLILTGDATARGKRLR
jgi:hypothetical protein